MNEAWVNWPASQRQGPPNATPIDEVFLRYRWRQRMRAARTVDVAPYLHGSGALNTYLWIPPWALGLLFTLRFGLEVIDSPSGPANTGASARFTIGGRSSTTAFAAGVGDGETLVSVLSCDWEPTEADLGLVLPVSFSAAVIPPASAGAAYKNDTPETRLPWSWG